MVSLNRIQEPTEDLFNMQELKDHLRLAVVTGADESNLQAYLDAATDFVEGVAGCSIMKQKWQLNLDQFPSKPILLPRGPVYQIESFKYIDISGDQQIVTSDNYIFDKNSKPPAIHPPYAGFFPSARETPNAVEIIYTTGMGIDPSDGADDSNRVRTSIKQAVKFLSGHWYQNREPVPIANENVQKLPHALETMLWASRVYRFDWEAYYSC